MPNLNRNIRAAGDLKNFVHRFINRVCFAALMRDVNAAILMRDPGQFDNLIGFREPRRHVLK